MPLTESTPDPVPPELAPFVARAQERLEQATEGLDPDETIAHLEAAVARAEAEASRLGFVHAVVPRSAPEPPPGMRLTRATSIVDALHNRTSTLHAV